MSHLVIARKYRPSKFSEVIGQKQVTQTLANSIINGKIAHAYLFSGPRGVGKTTTARIMAKAVNCEKFPAAEPCGKCASCKEIASGSSLDIIELDAASNRGIDSIQELRENAAFAPASSRYKVYVIDEAHQITTDAFNALLKTLEEPPPYVIFILATTAPEKVPVTILSRCQHFKFRLVSDDEIKSSLKKICSSEKIKIKPEALDIICAEAAGSLRDSQSILEQVISSSEKKEIGPGDVEFVLGLVESKKVREILKAVSEKNVKKAYEITDEIYRGGYSLQQFAMQLSLALREILAEKIEGKTPPILADASGDRLFWMLESVCSAEKEMKYSEFPKIVLELCLYKISSDFVSIDEAVSRVSSGPVPAPAAEPAAPDADGVQAQNGIKQSSGKENVLRVLESCGSVGNIFPRAVKIEIRKGVLYCEFASEDEPAAKRIIANSEYIEDKLRSSGFPLTLEIAIVMPDGAAEEKKAPATTAAQLEIEEPIIKKLHDIAGGELEGPSDE